MTVLVRRPGVRKTRKNALCMRYSVFCWRVCALQHKYAEKKRENFETRGGVIIGDEKGTPQQAVDPVA